MKEIYKKLAQIQKELEAPKNLFNKHGNYNYRSCESILNAIKPLLDDYSLILHDEMVMIGERYYIKATAILTDGEESVENTAFAREQEERKGMDQSQITGASSSYARKYALNGLFMIDDVKDADGVEPEQVSDQSQYPVDERPWLNEKQFNAAVTRMEAGEVGLYEEIDQQFRIKKDYRNKLKSLV